MIEYENFIYLDVYRTGSTHIMNLLGTICEERMVRTRRHMSLTLGRPHGLTSGKLVFATVRNPWDWYVSLWAHGADGKSAIRRYLSSHLDQKQLDALYDRADSAASFQRWMATVHDPLVLNKVMKEFLPQSGLASEIGLYSYRFLRVTTRFPIIFLRRPFLLSAEKASSFLESHRAYSLVMRNEHLTDDLVSFVETYKAQFRFKPNAVELIRKADNNRRNASGRKLASYRDYYDEASVQLVAKRDRLFSDAFGYEY